MIKESTETYFYLTPYKGLCVVMCLLNGDFSKHRASKKYYFVYLVNLFPIISPIFVGKGSM